LIARSDGHATIIIKHTGNKLFDRKIVCLLFFI